MKKQSFSYTRLEEYPFNLSKVFITQTNNIVCYECGLLFSDDKFIKSVGSLKNWEPTYFFERKNGNKPYWIATIHAVFCSCDCATTFYEREGNDYGEYWDSTRIEK